MKFHSNVNILGVLQTFVKNKLINSCFLLKHSKPRKCDLHFPRAGAVTFFMKRNFLEEFVKYKLECSYIWGPCVLISGGKTSAAGDRGMEVL